VKERIEEITGCSAVSIRSVSCVENITSFIVLILNEASTGYNFNIEISCRLSFGTVLCYF